MILFCPCLLVETIFFQIFFTKTRIGVRSILLLEFFPRGFINKGRAPGKLTGCERDLAMNLPGCFHLLFLLSFIRKTKNARLKTPTDFLHKNLMRSLFSPIMVTFGLGNWLIKSDWYELDLLITYNFLIGSTIKIVNRGVGAHIQHVPWGVPWKVPSIWGKMH